MSKCKACGAEIVWIRTQTGKKMPCDAEQVVYKCGTRDRIVTPNGMVIACEIQEETTPESAGIGYKPHWASCPAADGFRKGGRP